MFRVKRCRVFERKYSKGLFILRRAARVPDFRNPRSLCFWKSRKSKRQVGIQKIYRNSEEEYFGNCRIVGGSPTGNPSLLTAILAACNSVIIDIMVNDPRHVAPGAKEGISPIYFCGRSFREYID